MSAPRTCLECEFFHVDSASPGYSDVTPGIEWGMECLKTVWRFDPYTADNAKFREVLRSAAWCNEFEPYQLMADVKGEK